MLNTTPTISRIHCTGKLGRPLPLSGSPFPVSVTKIKQKILKGTDIWITLLWSLVFQSANWRDLESMRQVWGGNYPTNGMTFQLKHTHSFLILGMGGGGGGFQFTFFRFSKNLYLWSQNPNKRVCSVWWCIVIKRALG